MKEVWRDVEGYDGYQVSNLGRVRSLKQSKTYILKPQSDKHGYLYVNLYKSGRMKTSKVHRLVAIAFVPNPDDKSQVNHIDGDKTNNRVGNLEWATGKENVQHAFATGLQYQGEDCRKAKFSNEQVVYIRNNPDGLTGVELAEKFGVSSATIYFIQRGVTYKSAGGRIRDKIEQRVPDNVCAQIREEYKNGVHGCGKESLARKYGIGATTVYKILNGK